MSRRSLSIARFCQGFPSASNAHFSSVMLCSQVHLIARKCSAPGPPFRGPNATHSNVKRAKTLSSTSQKSLVRAQATTAMGMKEEISSDALAQDAVVWASQHGLVRIPISLTSFSVFHRGGSDNFVLVFRPELRYMRQLQPTCPQSRPLTKIPSLTSACLFSS